LTVPSLCVHRPVLRVYVLHPILANAKLVGLGLYAVLVYAKVVKMECAQLLRSASATTGTWGPIVILQSVTRHACMGLLMNLINVRVMKDGLGFYVTYRTAPKGVATGIVRMLKSANATLDIIVLIL
jgi:hypothetical protein